MLTKLLLQLKRLHAKEDFVLNCANILYRFDIKIALNISNFKLKVSLNTMYVKDYYTPNQILACFLLCLKIIN